MGVGIELPLAVPGVGKTWVALSAIDAVLPIENSPYSPSFTILLRGHTEPLRVVFPDGEGSLMERAKAIEGLRGHLIYALQNAATP